VFTPGGSPQWTDIGVTVDPGNGCPSGGASRPVAVVGLEVRDGGNVINQNEYVYIGNSPALPALTARLLPGALPGTAGWDYLVEYLRANRGDRAPYAWSDSAASSTTLRVNNPQRILGGTATVSVDYGGGERSFVFYIRGYNPTAAQVRANNSIVTGPWFSMAMARHESGSGCGDVILQFNEVGTLGPGWDDYRHCPNRTPDYGWGIMQLTNPPPQDVHLWDWHRNLARGIEYLGELLGNAQDSWNNSVTRFNDYRTWVDPSAQPPTSDTYGCVTYAYEPGAGERSFRDAIWMKRYNGAPNGDYIQWDDANKAWVKSPLNNHDINYVSRVSAQYCACPGQ